jgi:phospholipase C
MRAVTSVFAAVVAGALAVGAPAAAAAPRARPTATPIEHFVFLMQAGRTFDSYFGTYPGADGLPAGACQPLAPAQPRLGCVRPFVARGAAPQAITTSALIAARQYDGGRMDGFVAAYRQRHVDVRSVMGYYDQTALPFYWTVAQHYVLFDHFFSSALCCSRTNLSYWVAAAPPPAGGSGGVVPSGQHPGTGPAPAYGPGQQQLTIFDRLQAAGISWKFYVQGYRGGTGGRPAAAASTASQAARIPLLSYRRFTDNPALSTHIVGLDQYYQDAASGTLPAVAFIVGSPGDNERSPRTIAAGQTLVRSLVTQLMESRDWDSSALLWSYDGSGGLYDHVAPPPSASGPLGFRVPALLVSAYARRGQVNHTVLSYASALRFIEQNWGLRPLTQEDSAAASLDSAFDFSAGPRPPDITAPASAAAGQQPLPATVPVGLVYLLYGCAAAVAAALVLLAQRQGAARRRVPAPRHAEPKGVPET